MIQSIFYDNFMGKMYYIPAPFAKMYNREFLRGDYNTGFMEKHGDHLLELYDAAGGRLNESV